MDVRDERVGQSAEGTSRPQFSRQDAFARVIEASPNALVLVGSDGRIELANATADMMFGYGSGELSGLPIEDLMPARSRACHMVRRQRFQQQPLTRRMGEAGEFWGLRRDGTELPLEIGLNAIDLDGQPMILAAIVDVSARRATEAENERHRAELERSNADLEDFAYAASHDLKAPLRAIAHLAQWISEDIAPTASASTLQNLEMLQARAERLRRLLDGLLAYSRVGKSQAAPEAVDVAELVQGIVALLGPSSGFSVSFEGDAAPIYTHRSAIETVLENLIDNAIKHHDRPGGRVVVSLQRRDDLLEFRVSDDGPGIPPQFHNRIFVIFQRLASRDDVESSGIGLAIVKKKVMRHGGNIHVESAPPVRGTTFVFTWKEAAR